LQSGTKILRITKELGRTRERLGSKHPQSEQMPQSINTHHFIMDVQAISRKIATLSAKKNGGNNKIL
jgi:hypothetical protein